MRRIYDIHLKDFLKSLFPGGKFPTNIHEHLSSTDNEIIVEMYKAARDPGSPRYVLARRLVLREHFKEFYRRNLEDAKLNLDPGAAIYEAARGRYGEEAVRRDFYSKPEAAPEFPVLTRDGRIMSSLELSVVLPGIPPVSVDSVFVDRKFRDDAEDWLKKERGNVFKAVPKPHEE